MPANYPDYLNVPAARLGEGTGVRVRLLDDASIAQAMADDMFEALRAALDSGRAPVVIIPVGPVDQFPVLAEKIAAAELDCRSAVFINMDEYLDDSDHWLDATHPLSFRGYMRRAFYDLLPANLAPRSDNRVFPDPQRPEAIGELIAAGGGVDVCYGGIGINGHLAFNEPPEPGETVSREQFADLPTRVLSLARETRTINSVTVGGEISVVPRRAVTIGMREILAARSIRLYCNRPWQAAVVRRVLHGPITSACPASLVRGHADARLTAARQVAEVPDIRLR